MKYDIHFESVNCCGETLCGDNFQSKEVDGHTIIAHCDGLGHGTKAHELSTAACQILLDNWTGIESIHKLVEAISESLPICPIRGIGYSTFTLIDIEHNTRIINIVEYDNPPTVLLRKGEPLIAEWQVSDIDYGGQSKSILSARFESKPKDIIVVCSDGVTQSGLGFESMPRGWRSANLARFVEGVVQKRGKSTGFNAQELAARVVDKAVENDNYYPRDDISCTAIITQ